MAERRFTPDRWVRLSSTFYLDDRIVRVGPDAELLYVRGLAFARAQRTDGHVSDGQLPYVVVGLRNAPKAVEALVISGLWERNGDGYRVPKDKWERWQTTEGEIDARRTADRERKASWRDNHRQQDTDDDDRY